MWVLYSYGFRVKKRLQLSAKLSKPNNDQFTTTPISTVAIFCQKSKKVYLYSNIKHVYCQLCELTFLGAELIATTK